MPKRETQESTYGQGDSGQEDTGGSDVKNTTAEAAENAGLAEGELRQLRSDAGVNLLAGHEGNIAAWEASAEGQAWLADEPERQKQVEEENKENEKRAEEIDEPTRKYHEALDRGRKQAERKQAEADRK